MADIHWIKEELETRYGIIDLLEGADLNRNGVIEENERVDKNGDGKLDKEEWKRFLNDNRSALISAGGHFKYYFMFEKTFSPDNPIHDLLFIESELYSYDKITNAYQFVTDIMDKMRLAMSQGDIGPLAKLKLVYDLIDRAGIKLRPQDDESFISNIMRKVLDCDTSSFVVYSVAHEFGWPVYLVRTPSHVFIRWDDGKDIRFNIDYGKINNDGHYVLEFGISNTAISSGIYLKNQDYNEVLADYYGNRGLVMEEEGYHVRAITDYNKSLELNPKDYKSLLNRGASYARSDNYDMALNDFDGVIKLDPEKALAYYNRSRIKYWQGKYKESIADLNRAIKLNPRDGDFYESRAEIYLKLKRYEEARSDLIEARRLGVKRLSFRVDLINHGLFTEPFSMDADPFSDGREDRKANKIRF